MGIIVLLHIVSLCIYVYVCVCCSMELGLQQRVEYLSRAAVCAKSSTSHMLAAGDGEFLHELEDKMEVRIDAITSLLNSNILDRYLDIYLCKCGHQQLKLCSSVGVKLN